MLTNIMRKAQGTAIVARNLIGQGKVPYLPQDELFRLRDRRVREIVGYAARTVPFYRDFFQSSGLDPAEIRTAGDLARLPLIDKQVVRAQPERFLSTSGRASVGHAEWSSGTTGVPICVWHDRESLLANSAYTGRLRAVVRRLLGTRGPYREVRIGSPTSPLNTVPQFLSENRYMPFPRQHVLLSVFGPVEEVISGINAHRPDVVASLYGSYLELLFRTLVARDIDMHRPGVLTHYADAVSAEGRRLIEEQFGIPVVSEYSATEAFKIGFVCEERCGFHCHEDLTHVRIVDGEGQTLPAGQEGEVVISNLVNHGTVLLNYRLGDVAVLRKERCRCGRTLRLLSLLEGRVSDILELPDGSLLHSGRVRGVYNKRMREDPCGLLQYQLIQREWDTFEFRLATVDQESYDRAIGPFLADLQAVLGADVTIEPLRFAQRLPPGPGGKLRSVIAMRRPPTSNSPEGETEA